jgi:two-component system nitrate/nitrite response regulator NarL
MSIQRISVLVVEPLLLLRQGLISLISSYSFAQVVGVASIDELEIQGASDQYNPRVMIFGYSYCPEAALSAAVQLRKTGHPAKIVSLYRSLGAAEVQHIATSAIDACVPLDASEAILIQIIELLSAANVSAVIWGRAFKSNSFEGEDNSLALTQSTPIAHPKDCGRSLESSVQVPSSLQSATQLSERECQILHDLTLGHSNKHIARTYGITEAKIKAHMKAIFRKIQVTNRTQAAIWAMQQGPAPNH